MIKGHLQALGAWFERQKRVLPWRDEPSLYRVWVSEIMLQQTQVVTVVPYFERFLRRFPDVESLSRAAEEEVLGLWAGLGYYSRARNLRKGAQKIVADGRFPRTREEWLEIPGVGQYTAGAILSIALDLPEAILDGNVERVLSRLRRVGREEGDAAYKEKLWALSRECVTKGAKAGVRPSVLNQALMELGATLCTPRAPRCGECPLRKACRARAKKDVEAWPPKRKKREWLEVGEEVHWISDQDGRVLVRLRDSGEWRSGLWDLPESFPDRLSGQSRAKALGSVETRHVVTRHRIHRVTQVWKLKLKPVPAKDSLGKKEKLRWILPNESEVPVGSAFVKTMKKVAESFPELTG